MPEPCRQGDSDFLGGKFFFFGRGSWAERGGAWETMRHKWMLLMGNSESWNPWMQMETWLAGHLLGYSVHGLFKLVVLRNFLDAPPPSSSETFPHAYFALTYFK